MGEATGVIEADRAAAEVELSGTHLRASRECVGSPGEVQRARPTNGGSGGMAVAGRQVQSRPRRKQNRTAVGATCTETQRSPLHVHGAAVVEAYAGCGAAETDGAGAQFGEGCPGVVVEGVDPATANAVEPKGAAVGGEAAIILECPTVEDHLNNDASPGSSTVVLQHPAENSAASTPVQRAAAGNDRPATPAHRPVRPVQRAGDCHVPGTGQRAGREVQDGVRRNCAGSVNGECSAGHRERLDSAVAAESDHAGVGIGVYRDCVGAGIGNHNVVAHAGNLVWAPVGSDAPISSGGVGPVDICAAYD